MKRFKQILSLSLLMVVHQSCSLSEPEKTSMKCHDDEYGLSYILSGSCKDGHCDAVSGQFAFHFQSGMCPDGFICGR